MCHNTATADRFYALNLDVKQAKEMRLHFEAMSATPAAECPASASTGPTHRTSSRKRATKESTDSSSEEEGEVPYQESEGSSLEQELEERRQRKAAGLESEKEDDGAEGPPTLPLQQVSTSVLTQRQIPCFPCLKKELQRVSSVSTDA